MRQKNTKQMLDYWLSLFWEAGNVRGGGSGLTWPSRNDIQPSRCRTILGNMFILERDNSHVNYRLAGTHLCSLYGRELKQEPFSHVFASEDQRSADSWIYRLGVEDYVVLMCSLGQGENGELINIETLLLPLIHNGKPGERLLGITTPCENPAWLGISPVVTQSIRSVRIMRPWETLPTGLQLTGTSQMFDGHDQRRMDVASPPMFSAGKQVVSDNPEEAELSTPRRIKHLRIIDGGLR
jgi:hypothetical protein